MFKLRLRFNKLQSMPGKHENTNSWCFDHNLLGYFLFFFLHREYTYGGKNTNSILEKESKLNGVEIEKGLTMTFITRWGCFFSFPWY